MSKDSNFRGKRPPEKKVEPWMVTDPSYSAQVKTTNFEIKMYTGDGDEYDKLHSEYLSLWFKKKSGTKYQLNIGELSMEELNAFIGFMEMVTDRARHVCAARDAAAEQMHEEGTYTDDRLYRRFPILTTIERGVIKHHSRVPGRPQTMDVQPGNDADNGNSERRAEGPGRESSAAVVEQEPRENLVTEDDQTQDF